MLKIKTKSRKIAFLLAVVIVFVMLCFTIHETEATFSLLPDNNAIATDEMPSYSLLKPAAALSAFRTASPYLPHGELSKYMLLIGCRVPVQSADPFFYLLTLSAFVYLVPAQLYDARAVYKRQLPVLALSLGGNSPPVFLTL